MGKGDKKSRRGKIILGTFGVRRRHKKAAAAPKSLIAAVEKEVKVRKPVREKAEIKEAGTAEVKAVKEKAPKAAKAVKEKKETGEAAAEPKAKKEKKS